MGLKTNCLSLEIMCLIPFGLKNGCPSNIKIYDQNLSCHGELRKKRFGQMEQPGYDGIHMRGPLGPQHYTIAALRLFQELNPLLKSKTFPKFTQPHQRKTSNLPPMFDPSRPPPPINSQKKPIFTNRRHFDDRRNDADHWDCPQAKYQSENQSYRTNHKAGFTIPTQNRFNLFNHNQGNF